jgi:hypothetical protein
MADKKNKMSKETLLLLVVAGVGLAGLAVLQFARKDGTGSGDKSLVQAEGQTHQTDAQAAAPIQKIPGQLLRTDKYPEAGQPFRFYLEKSSQGPVYELDMGDGSPRKPFVNGVVEHTFRKQKNCFVTLYARYEGQEIVLDTMRKIIAHKREVAPTAPIIDY